MDPAVQLARQKAFIQAMRDFADALDAAVKSDMHPMRHGGPTGTCNHFPAWANLLRAQATAADSDLHNSLVNFRKHVESQLRAGMLVQPAGPFDPTKKH